MRRLLCATLATAAALAGPATAQAGNIRIDGGFAVRICESSSLMAVLQASSA